jgi:hypothetical protein
MKMSRPLCVHCGEGYGRRVINHEQTVLPKGSVIPPYAGNQIVITKRVNPYGSNQIAIKYGVWDGESWLSSYAPFCTLRCALDYARKAYCAQGVW